MNLISLDLSTKPGYAVFIDKKLVRYGTLFADMKAEQFGSYPFNYVALAEHVAERVLKEVIHPAFNLSKEPFTFVVEETTSSHAALSQKKVEFIHYAILKMFQQTGQVKVYYTRDGSWKSAIGAGLNAEERALNKKIKEYKAANNSKLAKLDLDGEGLKVVGKRTAQHAYLRTLKEQLGIALDLKDEDAAAAICMGLAFYKGVKLCTGILTPGKKKGKAVKGT